MCMYTPRYTYQDWTKPLAEHFSQLREITRQELHSKEEISNLRSSAPHAPFHQLQPRGARNLRRDVTPLYLGPHQAMRLAPR